MGAAVAAAALVCGYAYRMPDDYAQTAQTISPDVVTGLTEPAITDVMYEEIQKIMEEIHNEQERNL